ncbi:hypothetical protein ACH4M4_22670 [Streptomyces sp. NPDC017254]|uniref:hypothetical protein n=1 Tax=unclassified Streptomyces TaxID=2593676 RepID=UPI0037A798FF
MSTRARPPPGPPLPRALPWIGLGVAAVISAVLAPRPVRRRGRSPWVYPPLGVVLYVASPVGTWMILVS